MKVKTLCYIAIMANILFFCGFNINKNWPEAPIIPPAVAPEDFMIAVRNKDYKTVKRAIESSPGLINSELLNSKGESTGQRLIHVLSGEGNVEMLCWIISLHANVNVKDNNGNTPLHYSVRADKNIVQTTEVLVIWKANVNARNNDNKTPLGVANDSGVINYLKSKGADY